MFMAVEISRGFAAAEPLVNLALFHRDVRAHQQAAG
jgi:hypothetical protein